MTKKNKTTPLSERLKASFADVQKEEVLNYGFCLLRKITDNRRRTTKVIEKLKKDLHALDQFEEQLYSVLDSPNPFKKESLEKIEKGLDEI